MKFGQFAARRRLIEGRFALDGGAERSRRIGEGGQPDGTQGSPMTLIPMITDNFVRNAQKIVRDHGVLTMSPSGAGEAVP
jgi:hypothetical protein